MFVHVSNPHVASNHGNCKFSFGIDRTARQWWMNFTWKKDRWAKRVYRCWAFQCFRHQIPKTILSWTGSITPVTVLVYGRTALRTIFRIQIKCEFMQTKCATPKRKPSLGMSLHWPFSFHMIPNQQTYAIELKEKHEKTNRHRDTQNDVSYLGHPLQCRKMGCESLSYEKNAKPKQWKQWKSTWISEKTNKKYYVKLLLENLKKSRNTTENDGNIA